MERQERSTISISGSGHEDILSGVVMQMPSSSSSCPVVECLCGEIFLGSFQVTYSSVSELLCTYGATYQVMHERMRMGVAPLILMCTDW